jgi:hypothetical protein
MRSKIFENLECCGCVCAHQVCIKILCYGGVQYNLVSIAILLARITVKQQ